MKVKTLGIIGAGVVGQAMARCYMEYCNIRVYDVIKERSTHPLDMVLDSNLIMVCLPTPQKEGSLECDTSYVEKFFSDNISDFGKNSNKNFVIKSTVPIGFTKYLREKYQLSNLVHSPEFLTARCSFVDAQIPSRNVIGGPTCECRYQLANLYHERFPGAKLILCTSDESEAIKLFVNSFFAVKIAYFNEIRSLSDKLCLTWDTVLYGMLSDGRITHSHTNVPGPDGKFGFGGQCLPKDIANLSELLEENELGSFVCKGAYCRNILDREKKY